jgi:hypothetical protein
MQFGSKPFLGSRKGIAEVLGAFLLIIVVVVAVAALASFIAVAQANAQARSAYLSDVKNENLQIVNAQFEHNKTKSASSPFSDPTLWNNATLTIRNTNTANSQLNQVEVGRFWLPHWNATDSSGHLAPQTYGSGATPLLVPAKGSVMVLLNFTTYQQKIPRNSSVSLTLLTSSGNFFTTVFNPPTAVGQIGLTSVAYTYFNRDVITLDGSKSQSFNGSQIASYLWTIRVPTVAGSCATSEFGNPLQYTTVYVTGQVARFFQEQSSPPLLSGAFCLTGPFQASLSVTDTSGFEVNSSSVLIALGTDPSLAPIAMLSTIPSTLMCGSLTCPSFTITVQNLFGEGVSGAVVLVSHTGPINLNPYYATGAGGTIATGPLSCSASGGGTITLNINNLPAVTVPYAGC